MSESVKDQASRVLASIDTEPHEMADDLRAAILKSGLTMYRVAKDSKVGHASLHRFMHNKGDVSLGVFERLCEFMGLELKKGR